MRKGYIPTAELQIDNVTQTVISVGGASTTILAANPERKMVRIKHQSSGGSALIYIRFSASPATTTNALELSEGQTYEAGAGFSGVIYTGEIRCISSGAARPVYVEERF